MKRYNVFILILLFGQLANAQSGQANKADSVKKTDNVMIFSDQFAAPQYPGGMNAFSRYISTNLKYPEVARLIGINGKVDVQFVIDREGKIVEATPKSCIGAGCEAEAVSVLENSRTWRPGLQNGRPVRVMYTVPIAFSSDKTKVKMSELRASGYGFIFNIDGKLYLLDEAETIIGKSFPAERIAIAEPFYNAGKDAKFEMPEKKEVYLLIFKPTKS